MPSTFFRTFSQYIVIFLQKILPSLSDIGERLNKTNYSIYKTGRVIYEMNKFSKGISGNKSKLLKSHLKGDEIFLHLKDSLENHKIDCPLHLASESTYSSGKELYFYLRPHISAGYDASQLDAKKTFSTSVIYNTKGDQLICRELVDNSNTFCTFKNPYIFYKKWSWIVTDYFKKIKNPESFTFFPKNKSLSRIF